MDRKIAWFSYPDAEDTRKDCHGGTFNRYDAIRFPKFLRSNDRTGLAVNPPRSIPAAERIGAWCRRGDQIGIRFWLQVEAAGQGGLPQAY